MNNAIDFKKIYTAERLSVNGQNYRRVCLPQLILQRIAMFLDFQDIERFCESMDTVDMEQKKYKEAVYDNEIFWSEWLQERWPSHGAIETLRNVSLQARARFYDKKFRTMTVLQRLYWGDGRVNSLNLDHRRVDTSLFDGILQDNKIQELSLVSCELKDCEMSSLLRFPHLQTLNLSHNYIGADGVSMLRHLTSLQSLNLIACELGHNWSTSKLHWLTSLRHLALSQCPFGSLEENNDEEMHPVLSSSRLCSFKLINCVLSHRAIEQLSRNRALQHLCLTYCLIRPRDIELFGINACSLLSLDLYHTQVDDEALHKLLTQCLHLQSLNVQNTGITSRGIRALAQNNITLKELCVSDNNIGLEGAQILAQNSGLQTLDACGVRWDEYCIKTLFQGCDMALRSLDVSKNFLGIASIRTLWQCTAKSTTLTDLTMSHWGSLSDHIKIREALFNLPKAPLLRSLDFSYSKFGDKGCTALALSATMALQSVDLSQCHLTSRGAQQLALLKSLKKVILHHNRICDTGSQALVRSLPHLTVLDLCANRCTDRCTTSMACHKTLHTLNLSVSTVGDWGASTLASSLSLRSVSLVGTYVGESGLKALLDNTQLQFIDLSMDHFDDDDLFMLQHETRLNFRPF